MKRFCLLIILSLLIHGVSAQNYYQLYPITATVGSNGTQKRFECSVYDSILQSVQTYASPWFDVDSMSVVNSNYGFSTFFTYNQTMGYQDSISGFIVYDHVLSQFKPVIKTFIASPVTNASTNIDYAGVNYVELEFSTDIYENKFYYRYDITNHEWNVFNYFNGLTGDISYEGSSNSGVRYLVRSNDRVDYWMFDPASQYYNNSYAFYGAWYFTLEDDNIAVDLWGNSDYSYFVYDPYFGGWNGYTMSGLGNGIYKNGIFHGQRWPDISLPEYSYFGIYDQDAHTFKVDTLIDRTISPVQTNDGVVAYFDTSTNPDRIFFKAYNRALHNWVTDSLDAEGITGMNIQDGTVYWNDNSGNHSRGYINGSGWGNYTTPLQLDFYLTDLSGSSGIMLVHVRNNTIGTDSIRYDFGDGVMSFDNNKVLYHQYKNPGSYTICISDFAGTQTYCQTVSFSLCAIAGTATASNDSLCSGDSLTLNVSGYTGSVQWQSNIGNNWINESGAGANSASYTFLPTASKKYRAIISNGTCVPAVTNSIPVTVFSPANAGSAITVAEDTICSGQQVKVALSGWSGSVQWQYNAGNNWTNLNTSCSNQGDCTVMPLVTTSYRAVVSSGICSSDTSGVITINVFSFTNPVVTSDTICTAGVANLTATGPGTINWYISPNAASPLHTGSTYSPVISTNKTYYVRSHSGITYNVGATDTTFGNTSFNDTRNIGLRFTVSEQVILEYVYVYNLGGGSVKVELKEANGPTIGMSPNLTTTGRVPLYCGFELFPGKTYDLLYVGYADLYYNTSNATYPYTTPGSPVTIIGNLSPSFSTGPAYYYFYDWKIIEGCYSDPVAVNAVVGQIEKPTLVANGPQSFCSGDSVELITPLITNTTYQWIRNGTPVNGAVNETYFASIAGRYSVQIASDTCTSNSNILRITIPCISEFDPQQKLNESGQSFSASYLYATGSIHLYADGLTGENYNLTVIDLSGRNVFHTHGQLFSNKLEMEMETIPLAPGLYLVSLSTEYESRVQKVLISF